MSFHAPIRTKPSLASLLGRLRALSNWGARPLSIGLFLGHERMNLLQLRRTDAGMQVGAIVSLRYPGTREEVIANPKVLADLLKQAYAQQPFRGKRVVSCLPAEMVKIITVAYKPEEGQSDAAAVASEVQARLPGEAAETVVDFMPLRQEEGEAGKREALVAMAPRIKVMEYLTLLTGAGLQVDALDIGPAALARLVGYDGARKREDFPPGKNVLLVNFGANSSFMTVIWGRRLLLDRTVEFSEQRLFDRLKQALDMPEALAISIMYGGSAVRQEASQMVTDILRPEIGQLVAEITKTLVYMASRTRGKSMDCVYLAGRVARYPELVNALAQQLQIEVLALDPLAIFEVPQAAGFDRSVGTLGGMALTAGLALRGWTPHE